MEGRKANIMGRRLVNAWLSSVISISLVLLLVGLSSLLLVNAGVISDSIKENMKVAVLLKQNVPENEAMTFLKLIDKERFVKSSEYISKQQGIEEMKDLLGEDFLDVFDAAPIPISIELTLKPEYVTADSLDMVKSELLKSSSVEEVNYQRNLVDALNSNLKKISLVLGVFIFLMLFISYVLIGNTVRLDVYSKRFTVHTMKMVGATRRFIRGPFMIQSVFQGLFSAMVAVLALLGLLFLVKKEFPPFFELFGLKLLLSVIGIVIVSGIVICAVSTFFVVNKLVALNKDELYS